MSGRRASMDGRRFDMWQYIIPAISAIVVAVVEAVAAKDR